MVAGLPFKVPPLENVIFVFKFETTQPSIKLVRNKRGRISKQFRSITLNINEIQSEVAKILEKIIEENVDSFRADESFKVRPSYGYDKFYLDQIDGSYDESLQGLIHYIMYEEGFYKKFLNEQGYVDLEQTIKDHPKSIYGPTDEDENYEELQGQLDSIYWETISFVGKKLLGLGFDVEGSFTEYFECLDRDEIDACKVTVNENGEFDVVLAAVGDKKNNVIRTVCAITGLSLKEAKNLVTCPPPYTVKKAVSKKESEEIRVQLEDAGASVDIKKKPKG